MIENNVVRHLVDYARRAYTRGLVGGTGGNFSARTDQGRMVITASGLSLGDTAADNLIEMDLDSLAWQPNGDLLPSKEFHFHADILRRRPEINAVLHVHPPHVTAFSVLKRDIPMLTDAAFKQPPIPRVPFAPSGSRELQANVAEALDNNPTCKAILLEQHGLIVLGQDIRTAYDGADLIEELARIAFLQHALAAW